MNELDAERATPASTAYVGVFSLVFPLFDVFLNCFCSFAIDVGDDHTAAITEPSRFPRKKTAPAPARPGRIYLE